MKVGISFVSIANAAANLTAEDPGWSLGHVSSPRATGRLERPARAHPGGRRLDRTACAPSTPRSTTRSSSPTWSATATASTPATTEWSIIRPTRTQYANFSEWDIYRSEIELVSLLAPHQAGDMVQSLVNDAEQGGWLPKWAIVGGDASQMNGDSADPIIAAAYAFGVRGLRRARRR